MNKKGKMKRIIICIMGVEKVINFIKRGGKNIMRVLQTLPWHDIL
jgi:hypothetical protein